MAVAEAWADISYIPMARGFVYLAAVVDWFSRKILSWKLSITMDVSFCLEAPKRRFAKTGIFNTDQGSQFTSEAFTEQLRKNAIQISMDGKGCWRDNVFVERIWRTIKYEEVYLRAYDSVQEARTSLGKYIEFYNQTRPHSSLKGKTPNQVHLNRLPENHGSLTKTDPPPKNQRNLFKQTEPPLGQLEGVRFVPE